MGAKTLWGRFSGMLSRVFSLRKDSYAGMFADWFFRTLGLGDLSLTMKMLSFFLAIVVPLFLLLLIPLFPELLKINPDKFRPGRVVRRDSPLRS